MAKIDRKFLAHYINTAEPGESAVFERMGKDLEEYTPALHARVQKKTDIMGNLSVSISGYEKEGKVTTFYAEPGTGLFTRLQKIIDKGYTLDKLKTEVVDVKLWESPEAGKFPAVKEMAYIEVLGYGGDCNGYHISFALHYTGERNSGRFSIVEKSFTTA